MTWRNLSYVTSEDPSFSWLQIQVGAENKSWAENNRSIFWWTWTSIDSEGKGENFIQKSKKLQCDILVIVEDMG